MSIKRRYLFINSADRTLDSISTSDFRIKLPFSIQANKCKLIEASLVNSYFNITNRNNTFILNGSIIQIAPGCYTYSEITNLLTPSYFTSIYYDGIGCRMILNLPSAQSLTFPQPGSQYGSMNGVLGFPINYNQTATSHFGSYPPSIAQDNIFIDIEELSNSYMSSNFKNSTFCIQNNVNKNSVIFYSENSQYDQSVNECNVDNILNLLTIRVRDQYGDVVQGLPEFTFILKFY